MSYIVGTNVFLMIKKIKPKKYKPDNKITMASESMPVYRSVRLIPVVTDFSYRKFEKIAALVPFTQKEWASILHLSEKTLQRYSKDNKNFEGIYVDRILHIQELIKTGVETFTSPEAFYRWLKRDTPHLGMVLRFSDLVNSKGIQEHIDAMERLQHGIII
jgi:putative toxin-antitoxin system antitoxin component (TIGR02293 family)